ncbi:MAG TPA: 50S ribosomal protein L11 methyltransferase [candidate division Zixibacteria bacterium]|nr:50S ribosomal protein L11 methyltransferase [candidate division Zixibacteria bacterium]HEQ98030.1 50S ribosomal protein L11 methyltransferase [candidate division Zixibacteria bacterium]
MSDRPGHKSGRGYLEIAVTIPCQHEEMVSDFIIEEVAFGLVTEDLDDQVRIICYIPHDNGPDEKIDKLKKYLSIMEVLPDELIDERIKTKNIEEIDWINEYQKSFEPVVIGDLVIKTPWDKTEFPGKKIIIIEPKMAFGTGKHETTQLCLRAIEKEIEPGMKVLDLGTGSGILSIYAAMLGASEILGLDIDPDAVPNALENAEMNNVSDKFGARTGSMEQIDKKNYYDLVISNLIYDGIVKLFDDFLAALKPGGKMILSGILDDQKNQLTEFIKFKASFEIEIMQQNEWLCYILRTR